LRNCFYLIPYFFSPKIKLLTGNRDGEGIAGNHEKGFYRAGAGTGRKAVAAE
jgi:hypothetical protein